MLPLVLILLQVGCWQLASGFNLDVERAIVREGPAGSYFGFSVALLNNTSGGWLLAGAPLVKQNERSSGAIYKCPVIPLTSAPDCLEVPLSQTGAGPAGVMQIGVTLDMQPILKDKVVYCGHQIDHRSGHESNATVFGMCFELMQDLDYRRSSRIAPMTLGRGRVGGKDGQILDADNDEKIFYFPVHNSEGNTMIVGNPASQNGKGAVVLYRGNRRLKREAFKDKGGFAGYSLSSGRLFRDPRLYYLVGAPAVGKVHLLDDRLKPVKTLMGEQAGSYFGAAIAAVDLNGDGLDDIVVGAPLFSLSKEEGVVEVFISQNETPFEKSTFQLKGSEVPGARFGAAIENIGDMNRDTFEDIAVGAPFEDEGRGVVYIYNGFSTGIGLDGAYSQRIAAKELPGNIQGFGMSLSRVADLDGNAYRDLAIGAPQSDTAVVFLSRPVADLQPRFRINPTIIDPKVMNCRHDEKRATCIRIETCFVFRGYNLPNYLDVIFSMDVDVDADSPRVKLISGDGLSSQSNGTLRVSRRRTACSKYSAIVLPNVRDIYSPVVFNLAFDIAPGSNGEVSPVLSSFRSSSESTEVLFKRDCGDDNECHSDLVLNTRLVYPDNRAYLLLGVDETIRLRVNLLNSAEAAYLSTVLISHSDNVFFRSSPRSRVACVVQEDFIEFDNRTASSKNLKQVLCEVGNPIKMSEEQTFDLVFDTGRLSPMSQPVVFTTNARTASMETNYVNNVMRNQATLRLPVNTKLSGRSIPREMIVLRGAPEDAASPRKITHAYELIDLGPSVITKATVMLKIPTGNLTSDQVALDRVEVEGSDGGRAKCRRIRHQNMSQDEPAADMADQRHGTCSDGSCYAVRCTVKSLEPMQTILFRADMMLAEGAENLVEASQITLQTMAEISFPDDTIFMETEESSRHVMVSTTMMLEDYVAPEPTAEATAEPGTDGGETSEPEPHPETEPTAEPETVPGEPDTGEAAVAEGESAGSDTGGATKISTPIIPLLIILTLISKIYL